MVRTACFHCRVPGLDPKSCAVLPKKKVQRSEPDCLILNPSSTLTSIPVLSYACFLISKMEIMMATTS